MDGMETSDLIEKLEEVNPITILEALLARHCVITPETAILDYNCVPAFDLHMVKYKCTIIAASQSEALKRHALKVINYRNFGVCTQNQLNHVDMKFDYIFVVDFSMRRTYLNDQDFKTIHMRLKPEGKFLAIYLPFSFKEEVAEKYFNIAERLPGAFFSQQVLVMKPKEIIDAE